MLDLNARLLSLLHSIRILGCDSFRLCSDFGVACRLSEAEFTARRVVAELERIAEEARYQVTLKP